MDLQMQERRMWLGTGIGRVVALLALYGALSIPRNVGATEGREPGESGDFALRRLQALHDMYAGIEDRARFAAMKQRFESARAERTPRKPALPLPIHFPGVDVNEKLRLLKQTAPLRKSTALGFQMMMPKLTATPAASWSNIGPSNFAGRVSSVAVDPSNPAVIYRGTAGGGVWKTTDGGTSWIPLTDGLGTLSIGAVAVAPSDPKIVYVGTGEGVNTIDGIDGIGFISSSDGGATWALPISVSATKFFALSIHPNHANELLAATSAGIQKSIDGGLTWTVKVPNVYGTALARVPGEPNRIVATVWDVASDSSSHQGFVYLSTDGGDRWQKIGGAGILPFDPNTGRLSLAIAPSAPKTIYVLAASTTGNITECEDSAVDQIGFYRSTDGGASWTLQSNPYSGTCPTDSDQEGFVSILGGQGWYANTISVSLKDPNVVYAGGLDLWISKDGAKNWAPLSHWNLDPADAHYVHADIHTLDWIGTSLFIGNDGGVSVTPDQGVHFKELNSGVVTRQFYSVGVSGINGDLVIGGTQDNGTAVRIGATTTYREALGGDGFAVAVHPGSPNILYGTIYGSQIYRSTDGGQTFDYLGPNFTKEEQPYLPFITPLTMDPSDAKTLYTASNFLWKSTDGGDNWRKASATDLGAGTYVTKIAVAKSNPNYLLVITAFGAVRKSADGGATWSTLQGLQSGYGSHVEFDPATTECFYVAYTSSGSGHRLLKTTDGGKSFTAIDAALPKIPVHIVRIDPRDTKVLYVGTDAGLYKSVDGGMHWSRFGAGLPAVSVWDIAILPDASLMRIATHGRGIYELKL